MSHDIKHVVLTDDLRDNLLRIVKDKAPGLARPNQETLEALYVKCAEVSGGNDHTVDVLMYLFLAIRYGMMLDEAKAALATIKVSV